MITESLMALGSWDLTLDGLEEDTKAGAWQFETVCFCPQPVAAPTASTVFAASVFSGRVDWTDPGEPGQPFRAGGPSILAHLGDSGNKGPYLTAAAAPVGTTLGAVLISGNVFGTAARVAGLTLGNTTGLSANNLNDEVRDAPSSLTELHRLCQLTTVRTEYRCRPDRVVDFAASNTSNVFRTTPQVVITRYGPTGGEKDGSFYGYRASPLRKKVDWSDWAETVEGSNVATGYSASRGSGLTCVDGSTGIQVRKDIGDGNTTTTDIGQAGAAAFNHTYIARYQWTVEVEAYCFPEHCIVGDRVYVHDQHIGAVDGANQIAFGGATIFPQKVRVTGYQYPVKEGWAVYLVRTASGTSAVVDLTPNVMWETGKTKLNIDDRPMTMRSYVNQVTA